MSCHRELPVLCCCCLVPKLNPTLCDPVDCSTLGSPVLPSLSPAQTQRPSSRRYHPTISSFVVPSFFCPQSFLASRSFPKRQFFSSGGQGIGASASASVLPMNIQGWFPLGWTGLISLQFKGLAQESFLALQFESINALALSFMIQLSHLYTTTEKAIALTVWIFAGKVMSLLFNTLSRLVIAFLPRSKHLWFCGCSHRPQWFWSLRK